MAATGAPAFAHELSADGLDLFSRATWPDGRTSRSLLRWTDAAAAAPHLDDAKAHFEEQTNRSVRPPRSAAVLRRMLSRAAGVASL